jgi:hypothetical protein
VSLEEPASHNRIARPAERDDASVVVRRLPLAIHPVVKDTIFYGVFVVLFVLYGLIVGGAWRGEITLSASIMLAINSMAPMVLENLSLYSEAAPVVLGFIMGVTAPRRASWLQTLVILTLGVLLWLAYLHLQIFFTEGAARAFLDDSDRLDDEQIEQAIQTLSMAASSVRSFAAVVVAAVLGLRFNDDVEVFRTPRNKAAVGDGGPEGPTAGGTRGSDAGALATSEGSASSNKGALPMGGGS